MANWYSLHLRPYTREAGLGRRTLARTPEMASVLCHAALVTFVVSSSELAGMDGTSYSGCASRALGHRKRHFPTEVVEMLLLIDNYDSFTYNLVHYLGELGAKVSVWRNDAVTVDQIFADEVEAVVISPDLATPIVPEFVSNWFALQRGEFLFWGFAWVTRQ